MNTLTKTNATTLRTVVCAALSTVDDARQKCLIAGHLLNEARAAMLGEGSGRGRNQHTDGDAFGDWLEKHVPEIARNTAYTWMRAAANVAKAIGLPAALEIEATVIPISKLLSAPEAELPKAAFEWRQTWFDFTADKTIKQCLAGVFVEGDAAHRVDRAINGKVKGGNRGENRKDFPTFVKRHLAQITELLGSNEKNRERRWNGFTALEREQIQDGLATALAKWPTPLVQSVARLARQEASSR